MYTCIFIHFIRNVKQNHERRCKCVNSFLRGFYVPIVKWGVARRLFKSTHNMIEQRSLGVKAPGESKAERLCRGNWGRGGGWRSTPPSAIYVKTLF